MDWIAIVGLGVVLAIPLGLVVERIRRRRLQDEERTAKETAERVISEARTEAEAIRKEAEAKGTEIIQKGRKELEE